VDLRRRKWWEVGEDCIMRSFTTCTLHQMLLMIKSMRLACQVAHTGKMRNAYNILVRKPEEERPLRKSRYKW